MSKQAFVDKYRPTKIKDIVGNVEIISYLKTIKGKPQHLFFEGKAGTGKTTSARAICIELFGKEWKKNVLKKNASDDRGIDVIRNEIRRFASSKSYNSDYKIVILDECDGLTNEAQDALRGVMEKYSFNCSFILTCNKPEKVMDALTSRCKVFHFKPINKDQTIKLISKVVAKEHIEMEADVAEILAEQSKGDMRKVLQDLEVLKSKKRKIKIDDLNIINIEKIDPVVNDIIGGKFKSGQVGIYELIKEGYNADDILSRCFEKMKEEVQKPKKERTMGSILSLKIFSLISDTQRNIKIGTTDEVQLVGMLSTITRWRNKK